VYIVKQHVTYCHASWLFHVDYTLVITSAAFVIASTVEQSSRPTPVIASAAKQSPYEYDIVREIASLRSQ